MTWQTLLTDVQLHWSDAGTMLYTARQVLPQVPGARAFHNGLGPLRCYLSHNENDQWNRAKLTKQTRNKPETAKALVQKTAKRCHNQCRFNGLQPSCGDGSAGHHTLKSSLHTELSKPLSIFKPKGECHRNYWCPWCQFCMLSFSEKGLALSLSFELILS